MAYIIDEHGLVKYKPDDKDEKKSSPSADKKNNNGTLLFDDWYIYIPDNFVILSDFKAKNGKGFAAVSEGADTKCPENAKMYITAEKKDKTVPDTDLLGYEAAMRIELLLLEHYRAHDKSFNYTVRRESELHIYFQVSELNIGEAGIKSISFSVQIITTKGMYDVCIGFNQIGEKAFFFDELLKIISKIHVKDKNLTDCTYISELFNVSEKVSIKNSADVKTAVAYKKYLEELDKIKEKLLNEEDIFDKVEYLLSPVQNITVSAYELSETAWKYSAFFHVEDALYNPENDREAEIKHGYIRSIQNYTAFRSFCWCLEEYRFATDKEINQLSTDEVLALCLLVESRDNFNYSVFHGDPVCCTADMNTIFIDESQISSYKDVLNASGWDCGSLERLRGQLGDIKPAIDIIYNFLTNDSKNLKGIYSDILYTWCSLTLAAGKAFAIMPDSSEKYHFERKEMAFEEYSPLSSDINLFIKNDEDSGENISKLKYIFKDACTEAFKEVLNEMNLSIEQGRDIENIKLTGKEFISGERMEADGCPAIDFVLHHNKSEDGAEVSVYAFMLDENDKVSCPENIIYSGNLSSKDYSVGYSYGIYGPSVRIEPDKISADVAKTVVVFAVSADNQYTELSKLSSPVVGLNSQGTMIGYFPLTNITIEKTLLAFEFYRYNGVIRMKAIGSGFHDDITALAEKYGTNIK